LRRVFGRACRDARLRLRLTQCQVAESAGLSRGHISTIERARANPSLDTVEQVASALGLEVHLLVRTPPIIVGHQPRDLARARCSGYVERRLRTAGWRTAREVEIVQGRSHGWIDLVAFHSRSETLLVIEFKTRLDDLGAIERQLGWYGRSAFDAAKRLGWRPRRLVSWLLVLATQEVEDVIRHNGEQLRLAFPMRAREMLAWLSDGDHNVTGGGLALIDPTSKRREWLIRSRVDGRRSPSPFASYAAATRRLAS
jgi:transcriptional regulator with XRE-family HTH domain